MKRIVALLIVLTILLGLLGYTRLRDYVVATTLQAGYVVQEPWQDKLKAYYYKVFERASVYEFLRRAYYFFGVPKKGIIHIGARHAEELKYYQELGVNDVLWIEADPTAEQPLVQAVSKHPGSRVAIFAAADSEGTIQLHITSNSGHSSSILEPNLQRYYPDISETGQVTVEKHKLDNYLTLQDKEKYNTIVIDVQGAELIALRGAIDTLKHIDVVIAEINYAELYKGSVLIRELDAFLQKQGFTRVDTISGGYYTGDAMYIKEKFFKHEKTCSDKPEA